MVAKPAAYLGSPTQHTAPVTGVGSPNVLINNFPAWMATRPHTCPIHGPEAVVMASETVWINFAFAAREGDYLLGYGPPNRIMQGSPNVQIGSPEIGIAAPTERAFFCHSYCALRKDWPNLTPEQREARYEALAAAMFARFGAPPPGVSAEIPAGGAAGASWNAQNWQINVPTDAFTSNTPPPGDHLFHEIRHGQQTFTALRATGGNDGPQNVPGSVSEAAAAQLLDPSSPEARFGAVFASNELTNAGLANRSAVIQEIHDAVAAGGWGTQRTADAVAGYRHQPGGDDAHDVEAYGSCGGCP